MYTYSIDQWILIFYIYCFFGWCFESAYVSLRQKQFVNRGFLRLPMLPIYGFGALAILMVTLPVRDNRILIYVFGMVSATLLELVTGAAMEAIFKVRYWDYSDQKFNFMGHICLSSSIVWGFFSLLLTKVIHKPVEQMVLNLNPAVKWTLLSIISVCFVMDVIVSVKAAWDLRVLLEKLEKLKDKAEMLEARINDALEEQRENIEMQKERLAESIEVQKERLTEGIEAQKERLTESIEVQKERLTEGIEAQKERLTEGIEAQKERLTESIEVQKERFTESIEVRKERLAESIEIQKDRMAENRLQLEQVWEERRKYLEKTNIFTKALLRGNPGASSKMFGQGLAELKYKLRRHKEEDF